MKKILFPFSLILLFVFSGCMKDKCTTYRTYIEYTPVFMSMDEFRESVKITSPRQLERPGKIWIKDHLLFVNERNKGIHIFDNSNPALPFPLGFIEIPGNIDLAARGNILYADSYIDLLTFDISNPQSIELISRVIDVFPRNNMDRQHHNDYSNRIIVDYLEEEFTETWEGDCSDSRNGAIEFMDNSTRNFSPVSGSPSSVSQGGSMARFTIHENYLYTIDDTHLRMISIGDPFHPSIENALYVGQSIETVFPYRNSLFIGAANGMYIYDVSQASNPSFLSKFLHVNSCDPVVAEGNYAYVTLRGGTACGGFTNQLEVIDIENLRQPKLLKTYPMTEPYGLGIDNDILFICDGNDGLKVYDVKDKEKINKNQLAHFRNINTYDVIPFNKTLVMTGKDGIYQYNYSDVKNIKLLSRIPVNP